MKKLNRGNQLKHIKSDPGYIKGRSYLFGDLETAQNLVYTYGGTGDVKLRTDLKWTNKEFIVVDAPIGVYVSASGEEKVTTRFSIHYENKGTHVVPAQPNEELMK